MDTAAPSLRDTISAAVEEVEQAQTASVTETAPTGQTEKAEVATEAKTEVKTEGRTAGRPRDEQGRLLPGKAEKPAEAVVAPPSAPAKLGVKRPDSWKKELWTVWDKLDAGEALTAEERKQFLEYIPQREGEYQKGVGTYKTEYDRLKPIDEALKPYAPFLQQANMRPEQFVDALARTDQLLRFGAPDEKLRAFAKFAQDYQIPLHQLLTQGEDGKVYLNQQYFQQQQPAQQQGVSPQEIDRVVQARLMEAERSRQVREFLEAKDGDGKPRYPHFEEVKVTMDGLLRSGLYKDLPSAYEASLRLPQHSAIYEAQQTAKREAEAAAAAKAKAEVAARARAGQVSTKSQSPTGTVTSGKTGKGLREQLSETFDEVVGSGRV